MYCKNCGKELIENASFCPECGTPVSSVHESEFKKAEDPFNIGGQTYDQKPRVPKCFTVFGNVGFGLSLAGFICGFIPFICYVGIELALAGLVFSCLGQRDVNNLKKAKSGKVFGILGIIFSFIMIIVSTVISELALYY